MVQQAQVHELAAGAVVVGAEAVVAPNMNPVAGAADEGATNPVVVVLGGITKPVAELVPVLDGTTNPVVVPVPDGTTKPVVVLGDAVGKVKPGGGVVLPVAATKLKPGTGVNPVVLVAAESTFTFFPAEVGVGCWEVSFVEEGVDGVCFSSVFFGVASSGFLGVPAGLGASSTFLGDFTSSLFGAASSVFFGVSVGFFGVSTWVLVSSLFSGEGRTFFGVTSAVALSTFLTPPSFGASVALVGSEDCVDSFVGV